mmetsp:Transcript_16783/g.53106  ORF Transcript_16783/g.53106 Transcript_16783/m.53106 type:complete len:1478 (+) Transcript_16783:56-4489(+)
MDPLPPALDAVLLSPAYGSTEVTGNPAFVRTVPDSAVVSRAVADMVVDMGWRRVSVVSHSSVANNEMLLVQRSLSSAGVEVVSASWGGYEDSAATALRAVQDSGCKILLAYADAQSIIPLVLAAEDLGMTGSTGYVWVWSMAADPIELLSSLSRPTFEGQLSRLFHGHLFLEMYPGDPASAAAAEKGIAELSSSGRIDSYIPGGSSWWYSSAPISPGHSSLPIRRGNGYWYDAVWAMAAGLARTRKRAGTGPSARTSPAAVLSELRGVSFSGITGDVAFDGNGNRQASTVALVLQNFVCGPPGSSRASSPPPPAPAAPAAGGEGGGDIDWKYVNAGVWRAREDSIGLRSGEAEGGGGQWEVLSITWPDGTAFPLVPGDGMESGSAPRPDIQQMSPLEIAIVFTSVAVVLLLACVAAVVMGKRMHEVFDRQQLARFKSSGPPAAGQEITFVITDIQGSTALWDRYPDAMTEALPLHHACLRGALKSFYGYELTTEGDSFILAFHAAADAAQYALHVQQALMCVDWPPELVDGGEEFLAELATWSHPQPHSLEWLSRLSDALGVAMGPVERGPRSPSVSSEECYRGKFASSVESAGNSMNLDAKGPLGGEGSQDFGSSREPTPDRSDVGRPEVSNVGALYATGGKVCGAGQALFRGLRVRMGLHTGIAPRGSGQGSIHTGQKHVGYGGKVLKVARMVAEVPSGGHIIMSGDTLAAMNIEELRKGVAFTSDKYAVPEVARDLLIVHLGRHHMSAPGPRPSASVAPAGPMASLAGSLRSLTSFNKKSPPSPVPSNSHDVSGERPSMSLDLDSAAAAEALVGATGSDETELVMLVPGALRYRAVFHPEVQTRERLTPSFFQAPPKQRVAIVFVSLHRAQEMNEACPEAFDEMLATYVYTLRSSMGQYGAYEVEGGMDFLVAFSDPSQALLWMCWVHETLLRVPWPQEILEHDAAAPIIDGEGEAIYSGPRVRMGGALGRAYRTVPSSRTGMAEYMGPIMNLAARVSQIAQVGQTLVSEDLWKAGSGGGELAGVVASEVTAVDLGKHQLKGIVRPVQVFQVHTRALAKRAFGPLRTGTLQVISQAMERYVRISPDVSATPGGPEFEAHLTKNKRSSISKLSFTAWYGDSDHGENPQSGLRQAGSRPGSAETRRDHRSGGARQSAEREGTSTGGASAMVKDLVLKVFRGTKQRSRVSMSAEDMYTDGGITRYRAAPAHHSRSSSETYVRHPSSSLDLGRHSTLGDRSVSGGAGAGRKSFRASDGGAGPTWSSSRRERAMTPAEVARTSNDSGVSKGEAWPDENLRAGGRMARVSYNSFNNASMGIHIGNRSLINVLSAQRDSDIDEDDGPLEAPPNSSFTNYSGGSPSPLGGLPAMLGSRNTPTYQRGTWGSDGESSKRADPPPSWEVDIESGPVMTKIASLNHWGRHSSFVSGKGSNISARSSFSNGHGVASRGALETLADVQDEEAAACTVDLNRKGFGLLL